MQQNRGNLSWIKKRRWFLHPLTAWLLLSTSPLWAQNNGGFVTDKSGKGCKIFTNANGGNRTGEWSGNCVGGYATGDGVAKVYETDTLLYTCKARFAQGKSEGRGSMQFASGDVYTGLFKNNKRNGEGTLTLSSGRTVKGRWKDDYLENGYDSIPGKDGESYRLEYKEGKRQPVGLYTSRENKKQSFVILDDTTQSTDFRDALVLQKQTLATLTLAEDNPPAVQRLTLFKSPLRFYEDGQVKEVDGFRFSTTKEGKLFWAFDNVADIDSWFIITTGENGRYLQQQGSPGFPRFNTFLTDKDGGLVYQESNRLQKNQEYFIWFTRRTTGTKPAAQGIPFSVRLALADEATARQGVEAFFKPKKNLYSLFGLSNASPNDSAYWKAIETVKKRIKLPQSDLYYPKLLERFVRYDSTLTEAQLVSLLIGFAETPAYGRYNQYKDSLQTLIKRLSVGEAAQAREIGEKLLQTHPLYLMPLLRMLDHYKDAGMDRQAGICGKKVLQITNAMGLTGTGSASQPYFQLESGDEDFFLLLKHLKVVENEKVVDEAAKNNNRMLLNAVHCKDENGNGQTVYFFVSHLFTRNLVSEAQGGIKEKRN